MEEKTEVVAPAAQPEVPAPVTKESTPVTMETTPVTAPVTAQAAPGKHSEMVVLNKRKVCWANRDAFFACMDNNGKRFRAMSPYIFHQFNKFTVFYTLSLEKTAKIGNTCFQITIRMCVRQRKQLIMISVRVLG